VLIKVRAREGLGRYFLVGITSSQDTKEMLGG